MAHTESTVKNNPFRYTSVVRKAEAQIRLRGYEYYVPAEILHAHMHVRVLITILQYFNSSY